MRRNRKASLRQALATVLTGALIATAALVGVAAPAQAAGADAAASALSWGFKSSWRSYVANFGGTATASGGAMSNDSGYTWSPAAASFDPGAAEGSVQFGGSVQFAVPSHGIDIAVTDPRVDFAGGAGSVYWSAGSGGAVVLGATISSVSVSTPTTGAESTVTLTGSGVAFTADGAAAFGGSYAAGDAMDDLGFSLTYDAPVAAPTGTSTSLSVAPAGASVAGAEILLTATVAPAAAGSVTFFDSGSPLGAPVVVTAGTATFAVHPATAAAHGFSATFAPTDAAAFTGSASATVPHTVTAEPAQPGQPVLDPSIAVFLADGVTPYTGQPVYTDDALVVRGSGFDPTANVGGRGVPIPNTLPQGTYVVLGSFLDAWKPSASAASGTRKVVSQVWALAESVLDQVPVQYQGAIRAQWTELSEDGAFSATLTAQDFASGLADGNWGVYTYGAGGVSNATQERSVAVDYVGDRPGAGAAIRLNADSVPQGGALTVDGVGFPAGQTVTVTMNSEPITLGAAAADDSGAFSVTGSIPASFAPGVHTVVATAGDLSASAPVTVTATAIVPVPPAPAASAEPACVARAVSGASIEWGVKQSFRDYIAGGIAKGSFLGGWGSGSGSYNTQDDRGRVSFGGSMSFTGHGGTLDITISNPRIQVHSANSASLIVGVQSTAYNGSPGIESSSVVFATLSLPAAAETGSRIGWNNAAATLTAAGADAFAGFYTAGTALDPVTFSFPLGAEVPCDAATSAALAATGGEAPVDALWLGVGMLVLGAGVYVMRRRTARV
ncbi:HtaA domain-containing protein [Microbacterium terregens]|uniref:HtaA domain-containing protein n=1 Tax=Microbacterium terregens TaxID=69363 RepID=A0ABV5SW83_9MICO